MFVSPSSSFVASESAALPIQPTLTANCVVSSTLKSRTLYKGDKIAACKAQPRATLSSWFIVVERSLPPKASEHTLFTQGTREPPPTISTESICSKVRPEAAMAACKTFVTLSIAGLHISSKSALVILLAKSSSSIRHSQLTPASLLADKIFFVLDTASSSLKEAFLLLKGSHPTFFLNCEANSRIKHSSNSRPPTLSDLSTTTFNLPRTNWTIETEKMLTPIEQNATVIGFSGSKSFER
mmetsp:Transcript_83732/g.211104  ORF Transcript_83732/g.211104 Transcript_83732/m.211104 type:complete len:240 (+) Transcript_83732:1703-2422(+)